MSQYLKKIALMGAKYEHSSLCVYAFADYIKKIFPNKLDYLSSYFKYINDPIEREIEQKAKYKINQKVFCPKVKTTVKIEDRTLDTEKDFVENS